MTLPSFSINDVTHFEGNSGTTSYVFTVTKTGATAFNATVDYNTVNGTATAPSDYTAIPATALTFLPLETTKQITVSVNGDTTFEADETFTVHLSNATNATIADADGVGTIQNDDATPANLVVNTTADTNDGFCTSDPGGCTLREAINAANADVGNPHTITFDIPTSDPGHYYYATNGGAGVSAANVTPTAAALDSSIGNIDPDWPHSWWSIRPTSALPPITQAVTIDGYSQRPCSAPNASPCSQPNDNPAGEDAILSIELNGSTAGTGVNGLVVNSGADFTTIQGLAINHFTLNGIVLFSNGNAISGNFIGTDVSGTLAAANGSAGVSMNGAQGNIVGCTVAGERNIVSGNTGEGVEILGGSFNFVQGNFIGVAANGTSLLGNGGAGVEVYTAVPGATNNTIGAQPSVTGVHPEGASGFGCRAKKSVSSATNQNNPEAGLSPTVSLSGANIIAGNSGDGVRVTNAGDVNNSISQNSIY
ncbi:MAG TPA: Calx-beta domain-containing protein, partial [Planctomycetaceae bacterium]|nr:Calx-beta domain-containing protein [Planctomycetaceae bacterium]